MPRTCGCCASRRSAAATFWRSSPSCLERRAVRPHEAVGADRGGGGAAPQFRRRDRRRAVARATPPSRSAGAIRRSSMVSAICSRTRSISPASASRSRPTGTATTSPSPSPTTARASRRRSWTGSASPMSPAAAAAHERRRRSDGGLGLGFFIAKTLLERSGATLDFREPRVPGPRRDGHGALGPQRFRAADGIRAVMPAFDDPLTATGET